MKSVIIYPKVLLFTIPFLVGCDTFLGESNQSNVSENVMNRLDSDDEATAQPTRVTLLLTENPNVGVGGYYHAEINKYFDQYSIDVEIIPGDREQFNSEFVETTIYDFAIVEGDMFINAVAENDSIVALMAPLQSTPMSVYFHPAQIDFSLKDFTNGTFATWMESPSTDFLKSYLGQNSVEWTEYPGNPRPFLVDENMMITGYSYQESTLLESLAYESDFMTLDQFNYNPYGSVLVTHREMIDTERVIVRNFVNASQQGWNDYMTNYEETNELLDTFQTDYNLTQLNRSANKVSSHMILLPDGTFDYKMSENRWNELNDLMNELQILDSTRIEENVHFTNQYLIQD